LEDQQDACPIKNVVLKENIIKDFICNPTKEFQEFPPTGTEHLLALKECPQKAHNKQERHDLDPKSLKEQWQQRTKEKYIRGNTRPKILTHNKELIQNCHSPITKCQSREISMPGC
jgi:hypothetical protein